MAAQPPGDRSRRGRGNPFARVVLVAGCCAGVAMLASRVHWAARVDGDHGVRIVRLEPCPVWRPPWSAEPAADVATRANGESVASGPASEVHYAIEWERMLFDALFDLWAATGFATLLHLLTRMGRRDGVLRVAGGAFVGLSVGALCSLGPWCTAGGFGPPLQLECGSLGLLLGVAFALATMRRASRSATVEASRTAEGRSAR